MWKLCRSGMARAVGLVAHVRPAAEIVIGMMAGAEAALRRLGGG